MGSAEVLVSDQHSLFSGQLDLGRRRRCSLFLAPLGRVIFPPLSTEAFLLSKKLSRTRSFVIKFSHFNVFQLQPYSPQT